MTTYRQIVADIRARIESGELAPGTAVPSTRRLVAEHGVAMATATKALTALRHAGLVRAVPGVGTVVAEPADGAAPGAPAPPAAGRAPDPAVPGGPAGPADPAVPVGPAVPGDRPRTAPRRAGGQHRKPVRDKGTVDRDEVVATAIALADADGLAGVSMRRIAGELGIATMSVYRHVAGRDELIRLMLDAAIGEQPLPHPPPHGWRARCTVAARTLWGFCQRHPWAAQTLSMTRPQSIPNGMDYTEWLLAAFDGYGLDLNTRFQAGLIVLMFVRGLAGNIEPEVRARQDTGLTEDEWMTQQKPSMQAIVDPERFPQLSDAMRHEVDGDLDTMFEFGLARLLDGIEVFLGPPGRSVTR